METFKKLLNRRWWWATLAVLIGMVFLARLGIWQLGRYDQRREFNAKVVSRWRETPFDIVENELPTDLSALEYRRVQANGRYDYDHQIVLKNQTREGVPGAILVTPLEIGNGKAVLVARGWVPQNQSSPDSWAQFEEPSAEPVIGLLQESQLLPSGEAPEIPSEPQVEWFRINVDAVQPQMPYELLPMFILQLPEEDRPYTALPFREEPTGLIRDPGMHMSYAFQWFTFAMILGVGYFLLVRYQERRANLPFYDEEVAQYRDGVDLLPVPHEEGQT